MGTLVNCSLKDCLHWQEPKQNTAGLEEPCDCQHEDKEIYMSGERCPLYRQDWTKNQASNKTTSLAERFKNRGRKK